MMQKVIEARRRLVAKRQCETEALQAAALDRVRRAVAEPTATKADASAGDILVLKPRRDSGGVGAMVGALWSRIRIYQPTARIQAFLILASVFALLPGFVTALTVLGLAIGAIVYCSLGKDRVAELVAARFRRLRERNPDKAEALRMRAAAVSKVAVNLAAKCPERWTQGLYLPEFDAPGPVHEKMTRDPFDRL